MRNICMRLPVERSRQQAAATRQPHFYVLQYSILQYCNIEIPSFARSLCSGCSGQLRFGDTVAGIDSGALGLKTPQ